MSPGCEVVRLPCSSRGPITHQGSNRLDAEKESDRDDELVIKCPIRDDYLSPNNILFIEVDNRKATRRPI